MPGVRIGLAVAALAVSAWFGLSWVQARDTGTADAIAFGSSKLSAPRAARVRSLVDSAATLNPDRTVDLIRAQLALDVHDAPGAIRILEAVTQAEPQNAIAWEQLAYTEGAAGHLRLAEQAGHRLSQLVPKVR
jgi:predicted Zn-dependent protease